MHRFFAIIRREYPKLESHLSGIRLRGITPEAFKDALDKRDQDDSAKIRQLHGRRDLDDEQQKANDAVLG